MAITLNTASDYDAVFKIHYLKLADNLYNSFDNVMSLHKKTFGTIGGKQSQHPVEVTFGGGVGSSADGTLPEPNNTAFLEPVYTAKRDYARIKIDGLTVASSEKTEHAFVKAIDQETTGKLKSFNRRRAAELMNDGSGILGQYSGNAGGSAAAPTMTVLNTGNYRRRHAYFEKGDYVNVNQLASVFEISSYVRSSGLLTLARVSGADDLTGIGAGTHSIYWQNSRNADFYGYLGLLVNSTHYGVAEEWRYEPWDTDGNSETLDTEMLTDAIEQYETDTDETPTNLAFSPYQYRKYISLLEDQKRFPVPVEVKARANKMTSPDLLARVSFGGIQYVGSSGNITCMKNKFIRDDMIWLLNTNKAELRHVKKPGWRCKDNMIFLRMEDQDAYEARYICYSELQLNPWYVGFIRDLAIS